MDFTAANLKPLAVEQKIIRADGEGVVWVWNFRGPEEALADNQGRGNDKQRPETVSKGHGLGIVSNFFLLVKASLIATGKFRQISQMPECADPAEFC
jgi:hypothetical protein